MLRALEFYAGIGGLGRALARCNVEDVEVVAAFDHDPSATAVYAHNNPAHPINRGDISRLAADELARFDASVWLLSPPCQPYTVLSPDAKGHADPRASSFHHLMFAVLPELVRKGAHPRYMLVENVVGFKGSVTQAQALSQLTSLGYNHREFLLSPLQFGIPNSRKRYYLLAKHAYLNFDVPPATFEDWKDPRDSHEPEAAIELSHFLDADDAPETAESLVADKVLLKWAHEFDIVLPSARRTCCFTRGYTHLAQGSGSVLQPETRLDTSTTFEEFVDARSAQRLDAVEILRPLRLRYLTPTELLRLFCFLPPQKGGRVFSWPPQISRKTKYKLLGNSVNVLAVTHLLNYLFSEPAAL
ncbi:S-adenosyl-L-methionine-dependent methyltransferase [Exidia glandulosa HHB12029]|uniref:S-adenosyl-L-methionine-dependent methyltransferase n=1 Tax=Exidia glandulosa HHB12029 TaxID=1314781 RepID=A0A165PGF0_EXIGL|nr:S-adenosyl-L-methionine-dependent methyltransferase [Exidia glandulosa HHB12029]